MDASDALHTGASPFGDWLTSVGLGHLEPVLRAHDIAEDVVTSLTEHDLTQLGLSMGDRKRLMRAIVRLSDVGGQPASTGSAMLAPTLAHTELRQLTIMFCDLVDATSLSARLPPEAWRDVVLAYQQAAVEVITQHGGSVAQYLGDGLLVYFGYPQAQEDAAVHAVQAALALIQKVATLDIALPGHGAWPLQARIGVHTGMVVIGDIGAGARREQLALGEAPNIAARLQDMAAPLTVLITEATRRLAAGSFRYEHAGLHVLKGGLTPTKVWRVAGRSEVPSRFDARSEGALSPLVGRTQEMALLRDRWQAATQGQGQVVLISGEAGMGKSRLLRELREYLREHVRPHQGDAGLHALQCQCAPQHFADSTFHPLAEGVARALRFGPDMPASDKLGRIETLVCARHGLSPRHAALMAAMLGVPVDGRFELSPGTPRQRQQDTIDMVVELLTARAAQQPLLLCFEDAHWADPASLAALERIAMCVKDLPLLLLVTYRPEFVPTFAQQPHVTALKMPGLRRAEVATLVSRLMGGQPLPAAMAQQIQHRTDGVPLFIEELTRAWLEQPSAHQSDLAAFLPTTLRDSLMARLERHPHAKALAQIGAAIGREFSHALLQAVWGDQDEAQLAQGIDALVSAGLILRYEVAGDVKGDVQGEAQGERQGSVQYVFKHALVQDAAYDTLPSSRKVALHARIFDALLHGHPEMAQARPSLLARRAMAADQPHVALPLWRRASELALERLALHEAAAHLQAALQALARLPAATQRDQTELQLHTALGTVHMMGKGWAAPEAEASYQRASMLLDAAGSDDEAIWPLWGLSMYHLMRGAVSQAQVIGQRMEGVAGASHSRQARLVADMTHAQLHGHAGLFVQALAASEQVVCNHREPQDRALLTLYAIDPMLVGMVQRLHAQWVMGEVDDVDTAHAAIEQRALSLGHPCSQAWGCIHGALIHLHADQPEQLLASLHRGRQIAQAHSLAHLAALATFALGWCQTRIDDIDEGTEMMERGLAAYKATGAGLMLPWCLALLAEAQGRAGRHMEALETLSRAWARTEQGGERWHEAELHRIRGDLLASASEPDLSQARQCHEQAITVATAQGAQRWRQRALQALAALPPDEMGHSADLPC